MVPEEVVVGVEEVLPGGVEGQAYATAGDGWAVPAV